ncbi:MAG: hypothetical protein ACXADY_27275 [Candidatus Hodarchaeales archaeon]
MIQKQDDRKNIIHYIQPHGPFIGDMSVAKEGWYNNGNNFTKAGHTIWDKLKRKQMDLKRVIEAYDKTLELVLDKVEFLLPQLKGKTVISSDHGNAFGEDGAWSHPANTWIPCLYEVPYLEVA